MSIVSGNNYSKQDIKAWTNKEFGEFEQHAKGKEGFTIKGKNFKYQVTQGKDGESKVTVKSPWWGTRGMERKAMIKAGTFEQALSEANHRWNNGDSYKSEIGEHKASDVISTFNKQLGKIQDPEVAVYGKGMRNNIRERLDGAVEGKVVTVDMYNAGLGITGEAFTPKKLDDLLSKLNDGSLKNSLPTQGTQVSATRLKAWAGYLENNSGRLDILGKCSQLLQRDPKGMKLAQYLTKNCALSDIQPGLEGKFAELGNNKSAKLKLIQGTELYKTMVDLVQDRNSHDPVPKSVEKVLTTAFFRQTSKMGLEFFASQGVPIAFWTAAAGSENEVKPVKSDVVNQKNWQSLNSRSGFNEAITYSEMRHVNKLKTNLEGLQQKHQNIPTPNLNNNRTFEIVPLQVREYKTSDDQINRHLELHRDGSPI